MIKTLSGIDPDKQLIFDLLDIIHEQSETIVLMATSLSVETKDDHKKELALQMGVVSSRTHAKILRMGVRLGWKPAPADAGEGGR